MQRKLKLGIRAEHSQGKPKIRVMYYVLDMSTYKLELYHTLDLVSKAIVRRDSVLKRDVTHRMIDLQIGEDQCAILDNRFLIGRTEEIYLKCLKKDQILIGDMTNPTHTKGPKPLLL